MFHSFEDCQYVKGKDLYHGTGEEAVVAKKTRLCKVCEKKIHDGLIPDEMNEKEWTEMLNAAALSTEAAAD